MKKLLVVVLSLCFVLIVFAVVAEEIKIRTKTNPVDGAEMVYVPAGEFLMGSDDGKASSEEKPQHKVYLDGYWIYKYEVTVAQYKKFCKAMGKEMPPPPEWGPWEDNHPIGMVSWDEIQAYAKWAGCRLPTEAEWEKAARGTDGRKYPWGNEWDVKKCNNYDTWGEGTHKSTPVGSYPAGVSPYGCYDMAGNAWERCADYYSDEYFSNSPSKNPKGPAKGLDRVDKGGSYYGFPDHYRCSVRLFLGQGAGSKHWSTGFRLAADDTTQNK